MDYDRIILELLDRIKKLEGQVAELNERLDGTPAAKADDPMPAAKKVTTADIRAYIGALKRAAGDMGDPTLVLRAWDVHQALHLRNRLPMVCNAMRQCMGENDRVLYETKSGYSSSLEIEYALGEPEGSA